jgi:hypothetical protein
VFRRVVHDPGDDDRRDPVEPYGFGRGGSVRAHLRVHSVELRLGAVLVGVADHQPAPGEREHGDVAAYLLGVEGRLLVDQMADDRFAAERGLDRLGDQRRVIAAALDRGAQTGVEGAGVGSLGHRPILALPELARAHRVAAGFRGVVAGSWRFCRCPAEEWVPHNERIRAAAAVFGGGGIRYGGSRARIH